MIGRAPLAVNPGGRASAAVAPAHAGYYVSDTPLGASAIAAVDLMALLWMFGLALVGLVAVTFVALWIQIKYWIPRLNILVPYALEERITTEDGSAIELRRILPAAPASDTPSHLPPVLVVHGIAANHRNSDLHPDLSLPRYLARRGRDVWLVTLRSGLQCRTPAETRLVRFAHMARFDLPLAVATVQARTGVTRVDYVGFSMGAMLLYAALGRWMPETLIRRAALIGGPAIVRPPFWLPRWLGRVPLAYVPTVNLRFWAKAGALVAEWLRTPAHRLIINPTNMARGITQMSLVNMIQDVPGPLGYDFASWALADGAVRLDGRDVLEGLRQIGVPALFIAGAADRLAPPASVSAAADAWGAERDRVEKAFIVLGREHGASCDYGHGDLLLGTRAPAEVFEPIAKFLENA